MKTCELATAAAKIAQWVKPTQTAEVIRALQEIAPHSARPLKKSREAYVVRVERVSRPSVHYAPVFAWAPIDREGNPLTPTGRKMSARHSVLAYR